MAAKKKRKGSSVQGGALFSDGVGCTTPEQEAAKAKKKAAQLVKTEQDRLVARDLREDRIDEIASIMRRVATRDGKPTWNPTEAKRLQQKWGLDKRKLSDLATKASNKLILEIAAPNVGPLHRDLLAGVHSNLLKTYGAEDHRNFVAVGALADRILNNVQQVEVTVKVKEPTAADAKAAVAEQFGKNVAVPELTDGSEEAGSPSET